ncbi:hypothetical protein BZG36_04148 [Bifiguratus adelaidae]|uniref:Major facilitator superfamily (MFS) profile domain-containing protein n=1 Tax=Bifiguratus adelaidae TaxID=1938954 RepID=A0A261XZQ2_9FUNG|nr:hypothetical protein BZG36_04148 [Bifiguratus adelaidae]
MRNTDTVSQRSRLRRDSMVGSISERVSLLHAFDANPPQGVIPLPRMPMAVLSVCIFSEPLSSTILLPFIYFMVRDFGVTEDDKGIGFYAGTIASAYFMAQFLTSILWGLLSDRFGRKPVLLCGLLGNTITMIMFGMSKTLAFAVLSRCLCGALNGNVGVSKSVLGEITDHTNQPMAFAMFGFCWGVGGIAGPVIGGLLSNPVTQFPSLFGSFPLFEAYPYLLPCIVSAIISGAGLIIGFLYFEETHPLYAPKPTFHPSDDSNEDTLGPLLSRYPSGYETMSVRGSICGSYFGSARGSVQGSIRGSMYRYLHDHSEEASHQSTHYQPASGAMSIKSTQLKHIFADLASSVNTHASTIPEIISGFGTLQGAASDIDNDMNEDDELAHIDDLSQYNDETDPVHYLVMTEAEDVVIVGEAEVQSEIPAVAEENEEIAGSVVRQEEDAVTVVVAVPDYAKTQSIFSLSPISWAVIATYTMLGFHCMIFDELFSLYAVAEPIVGGLGWGAPDLAVSLSLMGLIQLVAQFGLYPRLTKHVSTMRLYRWSLIWYIPVYVACPLISKVATVKDVGIDLAVWWLTVLNLTVRFCLTTISYTAVMLMVNNSAPPEMLGTVNGIGQTSVSFVRAIGPALGGSIWSWSLTNSLPFPFDNYFIFLVMSVLTTVGYLLSLRVPEWVAEAREGTLALHVG